MFAIALAAIAGAGTLQQAVAQDSAFFSGKTLSLVVGYSAGGGYDQYARLLARHFGRHIPGQPSVVVQNMPGAASLTAVRYLANAGAEGRHRDHQCSIRGSSWSSLSAPDKFNVKFSDYQYLGGMSREVTICYAWHATGIKTWDDMMQRKEFLIGLTAKGSAVYANGAVLRKMFNAPIRQIAGYPGSNEQRLAVERGELEGACASWSAIPQDWIVNRKINRAGALRADQPRRHAGRRPTSTISPRTQEQRDVLDILNAPGQFGRPFIIAREVPRERVQIVDRGFCGDA